MSKKSKKDTDIVECENIATVKDLIEHIECEECRENYLFLMKDNYHEFFLPLNTVLNCVLFASDNGIIPRVPNKWRLELEGLYS